MDHPCKSCHYRHAKAICCIALEFLDKKVGLATLDVDAKSIVYFGIED